MKIILSLIITIVTFSLSAQIPTPAKKQTKSILLMNGYAHLGNGKVIENSVIGIKEGKLILIADVNKTKFDKEKYDTIIRLEGKHVYPGFIATNTILGLVEINAVRATKDMREIGGFNPHVRSIIAYNTASKITPTTRSNGILLGQIVPQGGVISGSSSVVEFDAWNWEDAIYKEDGGIHLNWPKISGQPTKATKKIYTGKITKLNEFFSTAQAYSKINAHQEMNIRNEAMRGLFNRTKTLFIHANYVKELTESILFAKKYNITKIVIVGGYDSWLITDLIKENNIGIILKRIHNLPAREDDDIDLSYKLPKILHDAGILFCLENSTDAMQARNLPFLAGSAAAYGMDKEEALQLITLNAAKILGIDTTVGSIEKGKDATLFISSGDALDMRTNNVELAFIRGKSIDLDNHQKQLYKKFTAKYKSK